MTPPKAEASKITVVRHSQGWRSFDLKELWSFRNLLFTMAFRDLKVRYAQTALGVTWALIQPFITMVVFSVIFGRWAKFPSGNVPYPVFVYAGLLPWTFFAASVTSATQSVLSAGPLITKVYFPRLIVPLSSIAVGAADFVIALGLMFVLMLFYGVPVTGSLLYLPVFMLMVLITALGTGILFSALITSYRDLRFVVPFVIQIWMYATPVVYPSALAPEKIRKFLYLNPIAGIVDGFRFVFLGQPIDPLLVLLSFAVSAALLAGGLFYFKQVESGFADII